MKLNKYCEFTMRSMNGAFDSFYVNVVAYQLHVCIETKVVDWLQYDTSWQTQGSQTNPAA